MKLKRLSPDIIIIIFITIIIPINTLSIGKGINCTNFAASCNGIVLFGNSEDSSENHPLYNNPDGTVIWILPASAENYGMMQIGWYWQGTHISYQGGINEFGLCYDSTAIPEINLNDHPEKPYNSQNSYIWRDILGKCRNITEAIDYINQFNFKQMGYQIFLTDITGDAVILSPNYAGELNFTHKGTSNGHLAQTNFNRIHPESHYGAYPCPRYQMCSNLLSDVISEDNLTIDYFKTILDAVHQNSVDSYTPYSNLFNPINQMAYFYYASQFSETVQLNLTYELSLGTHEYLLCDLVSEETHENGLKYHQDFIIRANMMRGLIIAGFVALIGCPIIGIYLFVKRRKKHREISP